MKLLYLIRLGERNDENCANLGLGLGLVRKE